MASKGKPADCAVPDDAAPLVQGADEVCSPGEAIARMAAGVHLVRARDGIIVYTNGRFDELLGYGPRELVGKHVSSVNAPTDRTPEETARVMFPSLTRTERWQGEVLNLRKDGTPIWCRAAVSCYTHPRHGEVYITVHEDISERRRVDQKLVAITKAVESTSDAVGISDAQGRHVYQNRALSELFGYATAEELQASGGGAAVVRDPEVARQMFGSIMSGKPWTGELDMVTRSGRVFPAYERADAIKDDEGHVIGLIGIITDITERKRAEGTLRLFRDLVFHSSDAIGMSTADGTHYYHNQAFDDLFGEVGGTPSGTVFADPLVGQHVFDTIKGGGSWQGEVQMLGRDRTVLTIFLRAYAIEDPAGRILGLVGLHTDITERKLAEEALRRSESQLQAILESTHDGILAVDGKGQVIRANRRFAELWRIPPSLLASHDDQALLAFVLDQLAEPDAFLRRVEALYGSAATDMDTIFFKDGRVFERYSSPMLVGDTVAGRVWSFHDITERRLAEEALKREQTMAMALMESLPDHIYFKDTASRFVRVNPAMARLFGVAEAAQVVGKTDADFFTAEHAQAALAAEQAVMRTGRPLLNLEEKETWPDGSESWVMTRKLPLRDGEGQVIGTCGISTDITEHKRGDAYREMGMQVLQGLNEPGTTQDFLHHVLTVLKTRTGFDAVGIRLQDDDDFPYVAQQGFPEEFLLTESRLAKRGAEGGVCRDKDGNACLECACGLVIAGRTDPSHPLFTRGGSFWTNDSFSLAGLPGNQDPRHHPRNQCARLGYASVALVPIRDGDRIVGLLQLNDRRKGCFNLEAVQLLEGIAAHIGAALTRRQAEEALRESEQLLRESQVVADVGSYALDIPLGRWVSSAVLDRVFGIDEAYERSVAGWRALIHPEDRAAMDEYLQNDVLRQGRAFDREYRIIRHNDQVERWVYGRGSLGLDAQGHPVRMVGTIQDITDRKQAEAEKASLEAQLQQAQKLESVGRLAGGVAHEFNNKLMGIMGYVELCRDGLPPEHPIRCYLDEITAEATHAADIARQLLGFARKQLVSPQVLDVGNALEGMLRMLRHLMGEDINLTWAPGAQLWPVRMDPGQLSQIVANLCVNARDAIAGVGRVTIRTANATLDDAYCAAHPDATPGDFVRLTVSDTGCGMDDDTLEHLFEPFFTTKGVGKGTGLGLATVYGIVEQNHGHIDVHSQVGKGTTFSIYLPRAPAVLGAAPVTETLTAPRPGTETILLAEDEESVRRATCHLLQRLGYTVLAAGTPEEALSLAGAHSGPIHLILSDVIMPGMNGPELAGLLADRRPNLKCLFMSGYSADVITHRGMLAPGTPFLPKPFARDDLARRVREVLDG